MIKTNRLIIIKHFFPLANERNFSCYLSVSIGQVTFNQRIDFNSPSSVLTSIYPTDSCYYLTGIIRDSLPPYNVGNLFTKFSLDGEQLFYKKLTDSISTYGTWRNTLFPIENDKFIVSGFEFRNDSSFVIYLKYDLEGNVIDFKQYPHPESAESLIITKDMKVLDDGYAFCASIDRDVGVDYFVIRTDFDGNVIWTKAIGDNRFEVPEYMVLDSINNLIIVGGRKTNQNLVTSNFEWQTYIVALDSLGNEVWNYLSPTSIGIRGEAREMVLLDDGSLIVASGIGTEVGFPPPTIVIYTKSIFKLDANQNLLWEKSFPEASQTSQAWTTNIIDLSDESGVVVAGTDAITDDATFFKLRGWLAKLNYDGDSIWTRAYQYLDTDLHHHEFYDLKEAPDGGLILCGESRDRTDDAEFPQQAWLLKLDEYGCLVPGCHLIDDVQEAENSRYELKLFPNPTSDYLNVFMRHHSGNQDFTFRILNSIGKQVAVFRERVNEETFMFDLGGYESGIYFFEIIQERETLKTIKFIKQ